jgi:hypothetical protein
MLCLSGCFLLCFFSCFCCCLGYCCSVFSVGLFAPIFGRVLLLVALAPFNKVTF